MARTVTEWIGVTDDTPVPPRVRLRVFEAFGGRCQICTRKIAAGESWICDHKRAVINGGPNRETNLWPICEWCDDKVKTPADVKQKSQSYKKRLKAAGIKKRSRFACAKDKPWRKKVNGEVVPR